MANESKPNIYQILQLSLAIKGYIDAKGGGSGGSTDLSAIESAVDSMKSVLKGTIKIADLNSWQGKNMNDNGLYSVLDASGRTMGILIVGSITTVCQSMLYIGPTASDPGRCSELKAPTTSGYGKQPGISFAVRYNVILGSLFVGSGIPNGLSEWQVMTIADYKNGFQLGGCGEKKWQGTLRQYEALTSIDPDTIYYILEDLENE